MLHHAGNFLPGATKVPLAPLTKEDVEFAEYKEDVAGPNNTGGFIMFDDIDKFQPFVESEKCPLHDAIKIEAMVKELPRVLAEKSYELGVCFMIDVVKEFNPRPFDVVKWRAIKGKRVNDKRPLEYIRVGLKHPSETFIEYVGVYCHMFFSNRQRMPRTYLDMRVALENFAEHRNTQPRMDGATVGQLAWAYRTKQAYPRQQVMTTALLPIENQSRRHPDIGTIPMNGHHPDIGTIPRTGRPRDIGTILRTGRQSAVDPAIENQHDMQSHQGRHARSNASRRLRLVDPATDGLRFHLHHVHYDDGPDHAITTRVAAHVVWHEATHDQDKGPPIEKARTAPEPLAVKNVAQHVDELREWLQHWQASQGGLFRQQQPSHETAQVAYRDLMSTLDAKVKALQQQGMELSQINQAAPAPAAEASTGAEDAKGIVAWGVGPGGTQWPVLWSGTELVYLFGTHEWSVVNTLKTGGDDFHIVPRRTVDVDALQEWNGPHHDALSTGPVKVALRQLFRDAMTEATV
ncbi:hypothetical protein DYB31_006584 [Aphanomyces astaci]|uniref:Uncharacterized protein n=1 Tax=Aphanomyces astaci TaxID=112090 RepID=A0A397FA77_APHAT|nr:hypothetical protein DYB31_006584 [Aphanomyces astaci]